MKVIKINSLTGIHLDEDGNIRDEDGALLGCNAERGFLPAAGCRQLSRTELRAIAMLITADCRLNRRSPTIDRILRMHGTMIPADIARQLNCSRQHVCAVIAKYAPKPAEDSQVTQQ